MQTKLMIGIPCGDGKVAINILSLLHGLRNSEISYNICAISGMSILMHARNLIFTEFVNSDSDYLLFIDTDQELDAEDLLKMIEYKKSIVACPVRLKNIDNITVNYGSVLEHDTESGLISVDKVGTGVMLISKNTANIVAEYIKNNNMMYEKRKVYNAFDQRVIYDEDPHIMGEDIAFCSLVRKCGEKIYVDNSISVGHIGLYDYRIFPKKIRGFNNLTSIILSTRNRPMGVYKFISSCMDSKLGDIEFIIGIEDWDKETENVIEVLSKKYKDIKLTQCTFPKNKILNEKSNALAKYATGNILWNGGDDLEILVPNWDKTLVDSIKDGIAWVNDGAGYENLPRHYAMSKETYNKLGWFVCPKVKHYYADNIAKDIFGDKGQPIHELRVLHKHWALGTGEKDETNAIDEKYFEEDRIAYEGLGDWIKEQREKIFSEGVNDNQGNDRCVKE